MVIAIDPNETFEYVLKDDRKADHPTVWNLRALNSVAVKTVQDRAGQLKGEVFTTNQGTMQLDILRYGLRGCAAFPDGKGGEVAYECQDGKTLNILGVQVKDPVADGFLDRIPLWAKAELAGAIADGSDLTEDQEKN